MWKLNWNLFRVSWNQLQYKYLNIPKTPWLIILFILKAVNQKAASDNEKNERITVIQKLEETEHELKVINTCLHLIFSELSLYLFH